MGRFGAPSHMRQDDFMYFFADIFVEDVQYGKVTELCKFITEEFEWRTYEQQLDKLVLRA